MFFHFSQNNSGGHFDFVESDGITHHVVIEAPNAEAANIEAIHKGLYFDGCDAGRDCSCCGDRWYRQWRDVDGDDIPTVYGHPLGKQVKEQGLLSRGWMKEGREIAVHYANGSIEWFNSDYSKAA